MRCLVRYLARCLAARVTARSAIALIVAALSVAAPIAAFAVQPDEVLADPVLEGRARSLSRELRCMVCQNQTIDDSDAPLARDLRILVRERLQAGDSDRQVIDFLVARYGEFVLLKPRFSLHTAVLWLGPLAVLALGAIGIFFAARRHWMRARATPALSGEGRLSPAEEGRLAEILREGEH